MKFHGGVAKDDLNIPNVQALRQGLCNLQAHVENMAQKFQLPTVVALNRFVSDSDEELETVLSFCENELGVKAVLTEVWAKGGQGAGAGGCCIAGDGNAQQRSRISSMTKYRA